MIMTLSGILKAYVFSANVLLLQSQIDNLTIKNHSQYSLLNQSHRHPYYVRQRKS